MTMKTPIACLLLACAGSLVPGLADAAGTPAAERPAMGACKADADRLCPDVKPGDGRIKACMKEHRKELSAECRKELGEARKASKG
jgi:hypothetical protein